jgi:hypothetical protein
MKLSFNTYHFVLMVAAASAAVASAVTADDIDLGLACGFAVLAKSGISTVPTSAINGDIGVSPIAATAMTGFSLTGTAVPLQFSSSSQVTGKCVAADYGAPISATLTQAVLDMQNAYTQCNNVVPNYDENLAFNGATPGTIGTNGGTPVVMFPGKYRYTVVLTIVDDITLDAQGDPNAVFIIQTSGGLDLATGKKVLLAGGARADNIYWTVAGVTSLQVGSVMEGNILGFTIISGFAGATLNGRALSQTAVTLISNNINKPEGCGEPVDDPASELFC